MGYFQRPYIIAHRGIHEYFPENSLEAISAATELNVDGFEFDVRCTRDGTIMLHHDASLKRMTGLPQKIYQLTDQQVKIHLQKSPRNYSDYFKEEITELRSILELFSRDYLLNIEVKTSGNLNALCIENLIALLREYKFPSSVIISSFNMHLLKKIHHIEPGIKLGLLIDKEFNRVDKKKLLSSPWYSLHPHYSFLSDPSWADFFISSGKSLYLWTVNHIEPYLKPYISYVDGIITDDPLTIMQQLAALKKDY